MLVLCSSGRNAKLPPTQNKIEADMRYLQPYSNPQLNSFQAVKLTAEGRLGKKISYSDGSVAGAARSLLLINDDNAVIDYGEAFYAVDIAQGKCLGYRAKTANSFVALGNGDKFYFSSSNQLVGATIKNFKNEELPDFFVPGLGQFSSMNNIRPQEEIFTAAIQNDGNPKYPEKTFIVFQKIYPTTNTNWILKLDGEAAPAPITVDGAVVVARDKKLTIIDNSGKLANEITSEFSPLSCSIGPDGQIYILSNTTRGSLLEAYDLSLNKKWEMIVDKHSLSQPPIVDAGPVIYLLGSGSVSAYRGERLIWETPIASDAAKATVSQNGQLVVTDGARIFCVDQSGMIKWTYQDSKGETFSTPPIFDSQGRVLAASDKSVIILE